MSSAEEVTERTSSASGFSFLLTPAVQLAVEQETPSSFSFLSPAAAADEATAASPLSVMSSGFSFISPTPSASDGIGADSLLGLSPYSMQQDIKLEKVATSKVVKKKKRATKIGFARDGEDCDVEGDGGAFKTAIAAAAAMEISSLPSPPSYIAEAPTVAAATEAATPTFAAASSSSSPPPPPANPPPPLPEPPTKDRLAYDAPAPASAAPVEKKSDKEPLRAPSSSSTTTEVKASIITAGGDDKSNLYTRLDSLTSDLSRSFRDASEASCRRYQELLSQLKTLRVNASREGLRIEESSGRLCELEAEQHALAEREEFEQAEALSASTEGLRAEIQRLTASLDRLKGSIVASETELKDCTDSQFASLQEVTAKLLSSKDKQQKDLSSTMRESSQQLQIEEAKLKAEEERVSLEMRLVEREEETLNEESKTTHDAINSQCGDTQVVKEQLDAQLAGVLSEIEELEQRLASKRAEERRLKLDVAGVDAKISEVRRKYERQLARIADRMKAIEKNKAECASERQSFVRERDSHDAKVAAVTLMVDKIENWSLYVDYELDSARILRDSLERSGVQMDSTGAVSEGGAGQLRTALAAAEMVLKSASHEQRDTAARLQAVTAECADIEERLPKVEAEKKAHAAAKRFKEAATAANTIKMLGARKEEIADEIVSLNDRIPSCAQAVSTASEARDSAAAALQGAQREEQISRFAHLVAQAREIRRARVSIAGSRVGFQEIRDAFELILHARFVGVLGEAEDIKDEYQLDDSLDVDEPVAGPVAEAVGEPLAQTEAEPLAQTEAEPLAQTEAEAASAEPSLHTDTPPAVEDSAREEEEGEDEEGRTLLEAARALREGLQQLAVKIEQATEAENYEQCADLDEEIGEKQAALRALLRGLGLPEDADDF